jgi:hypothetical protein
MLPRTEELDVLVRLRLRADDDPSLDDSYQFWLRNIRPDRHEAAYIEREVAIGRAGKQAGTGWKPSSAVGTPSQQAVIQAFRGATPLARIYTCIRNAGDWLSDTRSLSKAYVLACFSELAYLHLAKNEVPGRGRYKIFPSLLLAELVEHPPSLDLDAVTVGVGDFRSVAFESNSGNFVYAVFTTNQFVVVAVRGTVSLKDWGINLKALRSRGKRRGYHLGFLREAESAVGPLTDQIEPRQPIYFTGHSLGGAVASILPYVFPNTYNRMTPYVFAAPRFANTALAISEAPYAYVRAEDVVPHLPPKLFGFGNTGFPPALIPPNDHWLSGMNALRHCLGKGHSITRAHSMENYRHLLGREIGENFSPTVYLDALNIRPAASSA